MPLPSNLPGNWNIYDEDGNQALEFDTFFSATIKVETKIAQNPTERGKFADYNKSCSPVSVGVVLGKTGSTSDLSGMIEKLDELVISTKLLSVITPEKTFIDFNLVAYDYDRKAENGVDRLLVSLELEEVKQVEAEYSNEQIPPVKNPKQAGDKSARQTGKQTTNQPKQSTKDKLFSKPHDSQLAKRTSIGK